MNRSSEKLPETQCAIQLVGPDELRLNTSKEIDKPGKYQILARVEAVGLCFSDLKLLHQFSGHPRKSEVMSGISQDVLREIPSYKPGDLPTVPGHEAVCRIVAVGDAVEGVSVGDRYLIQTDYRWLKTESSNAAFGYNFEGALQEYVLMDERVITDPDSGQRMLIPASEEQSGSAICLVEPWACVEDSYVNEERQTIKAGGRLLVVVDPGREEEELDECFSPEGKPETCTKLAPGDGPAEQIGRLEDHHFDDIVYFGADAATIELLDGKLANRGVTNIVTGGEKIGRPLQISIGRTHYGMTRWIGTTGKGAAESYEHIPRNGEIRDGERIIVVGAGGPMGQMHVIRNICVATNNISITGTDFDEGRLETLRDKAGRLAEANGVKLELLNPNKTRPQGRFSYHAIMAPVPALVAEAVASSSEGALINVFAGIPAHVRHAIDLDTYIARGCFMFGTSGSALRDMKIVLRKLEAGALDTNASVDAVSGMAGAADGIAAVENRTLAGKIIVYPALHETPLIPLTQMAEHFPTVAEKLADGMWNKAAEKEFLRVAT
ncbi:MAG: alcohol dehydrogenase catalytic domain-containing protein [Planctomycetota bacterium]